MKKILVFVLIGFVIGAVGYYWIGKINVAGQTAFVQDEQKVTLPPITQAPILTAKPVEVTIPTLGISATIENVGLDNESRMDVPKDDYNVAWYELGVKPGEVGSAVFAGHFDTRAGTPAVFYELESIKIGDSIIVTDGNNKELTFVVRDIQIFSDAEFPIAEVFGNQGKKLLNLITCNGTYDRTAQNYSDRVVVFSELI